MLDEGKLMSGASFSMQMPSFVENTNINDRGNFTQTFLYLLYSILNWPFKVDSKGGQERYQLLGLHHGFFFKGRETLRGHNTAFISHEYERVKGRIF